MIVNSFNARNVLNRNLRGRSMSLIDDDTEKLNLAMANNDVQPYWTPRLFFQFIQHPRSDLSIFFR